MRVLYLTHRLPYAPNRGDRIRAYHTIRTLAARAELEVVSLVHDRKELAQADRLREMGVRVSTLRVPRVRNLANAAIRLAGRKPLTHMLLDAPGIRSSLWRIVHDRAPDVVLAYCSGMARFALEAPLAGYPLVVDLVDVDSYKWAALAHLSAWPMRCVYRREASRLATFEIALTRSAQKTLVVNERERHALRCLSPGADVVTVPNGVDWQPLTPHTPPEERPRIVFCGVMNYTPNVDAVVWFTSSVWPVIKAALPDAQFLIVGSNPTAAVRRLHSAEAGIAVTGSVDDVRPYLWRSSVAVAPLLTARGVQNKVLEALAARLPAVVTSPVFDGLPAVARAACRVADTPDAFARETIELLNLSGADRRRLVQMVDFEQLSWTVQLRPLFQLLSDAAAGVALAV
jgi:sugar transferase (PEP-CTERM/EpsH1 system associated)